MVEDTVSVTVTVYVVGRVFVVIIVTKWVVVEVMVVGLMVVTVLEVLVITVFVAV